MLNFIYKERNSLIVNQQIGKLLYITNTTQCYVLVVKNNRNINKVLNSPTLFQPAYAGVQEEPFDPALAALIALLVVLLVGAVTFTVVCCCLRHW